MHLNSFVDLFWLQRGILYLYLTRVDLSMPGLNQSNPRVGNLGTPNPYPATAMTNAVTYNAGSGFGSNMYTTDRRWARIVHARGQSLQGAVPVKNPKLNQKLNRSSKLGTINQFELGNIDVDNRRWTFHCLCLDLCWSRRLRMYLLTFWCWFDLYIMCK